MSTKSEPVATATPSEEKKPKKATIEEFTFDRLSDVNAVRIFQNVHTHSNLQYSRYSTYIYVDTE